MPPRLLPLPLLVPVLLARAVFDLLTLTLRLIVWLLLRACWTLEWAIDRLRTERAATQSETPPRPRYAPVRAPDIDAFMKATGTKDRAQAERLLAHAHRKESASA